MVVRFPQIHIFLTVFVAILHLLPERIVLVHTSSAFQNISTWRRDVSELEGVNYLLAHSPEARQTSSLPPEGYY